MPSLLKIDPVLLQFLERQQRPPLPQPVPGFQGGGSFEVGPSGRGYADITGTDYLSPEEREWYLNQQGKTVGMGGAPTALAPPPAPIPTLPQRPIIEYEGEPPSGPAQLPRPPVPEIGAGPPIVPLEQRIAQLPAWAQAEARRKAEEQRLGFGEQVANILSPELLRASAGPQTPTQAAVPIIQSGAGAVGRTLAEQAAIAAGLPGAREPAGNVGEQVGRALAPPTEADLFTLGLPGV